MEFVLLVVIVASGVCFAQMFNRIRGVEQRLRQLEWESFNRGDVGDAPVAMPVAPPVQRTVPPIRRSATIVQAPPPEPTFEQEPLPSDEPARVAAYSGPIEPDRNFPLPQPQQPQRSVIKNTPIAPKPARHAFNFEELFGRRLPIWAGGITLAIAGVFIVQYAIDIGLFGRVFTPAVQAIIGTIFGLGLIGGGEWAHRRQDKVEDVRVPQALSGAGISTLYAAVLVAANVYGLLPAGAAFVAMALITAGALALSLRHGIASAILGLAGGLAAPALTVGLSANVPMLSVYLALTIAGMVWVSRMQRWAWLGIAAMTGGAMWSALLILLGDLTGGFSVVALGGFVLLLALVIPTMARGEDKGKGIFTTGPLRAVAVVIGAAQLAMLVATGGFAMLNWGLYALLAVAGQAMTLPPLSLRFADHAKALAVVPRVSAALSVLLLLIWPQPGTGQLVVVAFAMAVIHIPAMLYRLWWPKDAGEWEAWELSAAALSIAAIFARHFGQAPDPTLNIGAYDLGTAVALCAGAALALLGATLGWNRGERHDDRRFIVLISVAGGLLMLAAIVGLPNGQYPIAFAAISAAWFGLGRGANEARVDQLAAAPMALTVAALFAHDGDGLLTEMYNLVGKISPEISASSVVRWGAVAGLASLFAWKLRVGQWQRNALCALAAVLGYGVAAHILPAAILPIIVAAGILGLALVSVRVPALAEDGRHALLPAIAALGSIALAWMFIPVFMWCSAALPSLLGQPMEVEGYYLTLAELVRRILGPTALIGAALWLVQGKLSIGVGQVAWAIIGVVSGIAAHSLYRNGFAAAFGTDFAATGLLQRFGWEVLLAGAAFALWRFGKGEARNSAAPAVLIAALAHFTTYSLLLHNPLWAAQSVGPWPLANFIALLFAALPLGLFALAKMRADAAIYITKALQPVIMIMVAMAAWATLRHAFHGAVLVGGGLAAGESIARSLLGLALAVGYLLWGIRTQSREWRIASLGLMLLSVGKVFLFDAAGLDGLARIGSFVALGFTLIGIGWLYARQLRQTNANTHVAGDAEHHQR
jgi:uncharacterized membrane protein